MDSKCDVCGELATVTRVGGHDGSREFEYCSIHDPERKLND